MVGKTPQGEVGLTGVPAIGDVYVCTVPGKSQAKRDRKPTDSVKKFE